MDVPLNALSIGDKAEDLLSFATWMNTLFTIEWVVRARRGLKLCQMDIVVNNINGIIEMGFSSSHMLNIVRS